MKNHLTLFLCFFIGQCFFFLSAALIYGIGDFSKRRFVKAFLVVSPITALIPLAAWAIWKQYLFK